MKDLFSKILTHLLFTHILSDNEIRALFRERVQFHST